MSTSQRVRRRFLKSAALATLATTAGLAVRTGHGEQTVPYSSGTLSPKLKAPANACDCHMHIYDSRFPIAPNATLRPPDAHPDDYRLLQKRI
ncbi:MAG: 2-pyrone-4,6-dicarboxylate hydrolase, partial [Betaproteobacteria bacterium]